MKSILQLHRFSAQRSLFSRDIAFVMIFCSWLFSPIHKNFTAIAHNMKGFDGQFIMAWMLQ
ncbi:unnamed protein product, partial [Larinioides sclopetarius]